MDSPELEKREDASRAVLVIPGIASSTDERPLENVIEAFGPCHVLRMDCWSGAEELNQLTLGDLHDLLEEANRLLEEECDFDEKVLLGKSFGAQLFLTYSNSLEADQMILLAPAIGTGGDNIEKWENTELSEASRVADISIGEESVSSIKEDTLILHGTEEEVINVEKSMEIRNMLPRCELEKIDGAGHSFDGAEEELVRRVNRFSCR